MTHLASETSGHGDPIVFLHGLTFDRATWRPIIDRVGDRALCVAVDLPGHGDTGAGPMALEPLADVLRAQLDELGIERPLLVGHSMGVALALTYAAVHPVRGVVTVDQSPWLRPFAELLQSMAAALAGDQFDEVFRRVFQPTMGFERLDPDLRAFALSRQRIRQDVVLGYWDEVLNTDPDALQKKLNTTIGAVGDPVLALFGRAVLPEERECLAQIPDVRIEEWDGGGHFVHLSEPDRFTDRILAVG